MPTVPSGFSVNSALKASRATSSKRAASAMKTLISSSMPRVKVSPSALMSTGTSPPRNGSANCQWPFVPGGKSTAPTTGRSKLGMSWRPGPRGGQSSRSSYRGIQFARRRLGQQTEHAQPRRAHLVRELAAQAFAEHPEQRRADGAVVFVAVAEQRVADAELAHRRLHHLDVLESLHRGVHELQEFLVAGGPVAEQQ